MRLPFILIPCILAFGTPIHAGTDEPGELLLKQRIDGRTFPSVFQAWSPADNLPNEDKNQTLARHDLIWNGPGFFGLRWNNAHAGLADGFTAQSVEHGLAFRKMILKLNPNMVLIAEVRYRDANKSYLPDSHPWWLRGANGQPVAGWQEGGFPCLDFHNPEFRQQVAKQCKAVVASGVVDGVMLDWWSDDPSRLALIQEVRRVVGDRAQSSPMQTHERRPRRLPISMAISWNAPKVRPPKTGSRLRTRLSGPRRTFVRLG